MRLHAGTHAATRPLPKQSSLAAHPRRLRTPLLLLARAAAEADSGGNNVTTATPTTLGRLGSLLGDDGAAVAASSSAAAPATAWWSAARPRQTAPPRQHSLSPGAPSGRFINETLLSPRSLRSGRATPLGAELDVPSSSPYFCYLLLALQLSVHVAGVWVTATQGPEASSELALALALDPSALLHGGGAAALATERARLLSCLLLHGGSAHLALDALMLGYIAPGAEALLGHAAFLAIYALSGVTGALTAAVLCSHDCVPIAAASGAAFGIVGAMLGFEQTNASFLREAASMRRGDAAALAARRARPWGALALMAATLALAAGGPEGDLIMGLRGHVAATLAGVWLGAAMGPRWRVQRELDIPDGAMAVPERADEVAVVVDMRTGGDRLLAGAAFASLLVAATAGAGQLHAQLAPLL